MSSIVGYLSSVVKDRKIALPIATLDQFRDDLTKNAENFSFIQEVWLDVIRSVLAGHISSTHAISLIKIGNEGSNSEQTTCCVSDVLWLLGTQLSSDAKAWASLCALTKDIALSGIVDLNILKTSLDIDLLIGAEITKETETQVRSRLVKINTQLLYRQQKYNLLNEENEGYSKLIVTMSTLPPYPQDISEHTGNVLSLVGTFDLDPNRVLDVVLTVFESQTWNINFFSLLKQFRRGNVAHVLGYKFSTYQKSSSPPDDGTSKQVIKAAPKSLYVLSALLIASGFVSIADLLAYLEPTVEEITKSVGPLDKEQKSQIRNYGNVSLKGTSDINSTIDSNKPSLRTLGALEGPVVSTTSSAVNPIKSLALPVVAQQPLATNKFNGKLNEAESSLVADAPTYYDDESKAGPAFADGNQIVGLICGLFSIRCWDFAYELIVVLESKSVDLLHFSDVKTSLTQLISWSISDLYEPISMRKLGLSNPSLRKRSDFVPELSSGQVKKFSNVLTFPTDILPILKLLGLHLGSNPVLFGQILRIMKVHTDTLLPQKDIDESKIFELLQPSFHLLSTVLLPCQSIGVCTASLSSMMWDLVQLFPFQKRYEMYDYWRGEGFGKDAIGKKKNILALAETKSLHQSKNLLKRLSMDTTKTIGRQLGREILSNPLVTYTYVLTQVEVYDNLIPHVVDAMKYGSKLSHDIMSYCLLISLRKDSDKLKKGDTHYSLWFASLAKFIGFWYRRYYPTELKGILHLLLQKLSNGQSLDLLVLKEILGKMGGCDTLTEISETQLDGFSGGRALRAEVMGSNIGEVTKKNSINALQNELMSSNTAIPALLFIAQIRSKILLCTDTTQLKLISYLYDTCQDVLMQFTEFLVSGVKNLESLARLMPPLETMLGELKMAVPVAFQVIRPLMRAALQCGENLADAPIYLQRWHPSSPEVISAAKNCLPKETWEYITPEFLISFWSLSLYDISVPEKRYEFEIKRINDKLGELQNNQVVIASGVPPNEQSNMIRQRKAEVLKLQTILSELKSEYEIQKVHVQKVRQLISSHKDSYILKGFADREKTVEILLQNCVFHRILMSPMDASFCSQYFLTLHDMEAKHFSTITYVKKVFMAVTPLVFTSSEAEASFIGYSLLPLFNSLNKWVHDARAYDAEAKNKYGFVKIEDNPEFDVSKRLSHADYVNLCKSWHKIIKECLMASLNSKEYMHIRSAMILMSRVSSQYPSRAIGGQDLLERVERIEKEENTRVDLKLMAKSLCSILKKQSAMWIKDSSVSQVKKNDMSIVMRGDRNKKHTGDTENLCRIDDRFKEEGKRDSFGTGKRNSSSDAFQGKNILPPQKGFSNQRGQSNEALDRRDESPRIAAGGRDSIGGGRDSVGTRDLSGYDLGKKRGRVDSFGDHGGDRGGPSPNDRGGDRSRNAPMDRVGDRDRNSLPPAQYDRIGGDKGGRSGSVNAPIQYDRGDRNALPPAQFDRGGERGDRDRNIPFPNDRGGDRDRNAPFPNDRVGGDRGRNPIPFHNDRGGDRDRNASFQNDRVGGDRDRNALFPNERGGGDIRGRGNGPQFPNDRGSGDISRGPPPGRNDRGAAPEGRGRVDSKDSNKRTRTS